MIWHAGAQRRISVSEAEERKINRMGVVLPEEPHLDGEAAAVLTDRLQQLGETGPPVSPTLSRTLTPMETNPPNPATTAVGEGEGSQGEAAPPTQSEEPYTPASAPQSGEGPSNPPGGAQPPPGEEILPLSPSHSGAEPDTNAAIVPALANTVSPKRGQLPPIKGVGLSPAPAEATPPVLALPGALDAAPMGPVPEARPLDIALPGALGAAPMGPVPEATPPDVELLSAAAHPGSSPLRGIPPRISEGGSHPAPEHPSPSSYSEHHLRVHMEEGVEDPQASFLTSIRKKFKKMSNKVVPLPPLKPGGIDSDSEDDSDSEMLVVPLPPLKADGIDSDSECDSDSEMLASGFKGAIDLSDSESETEVDPDEDCCPVCLDDPPNVLVGPCSHLLCMGCARDLCKRHLVTPVLCPYCRTVISGFSAAGGAKAKEWEKQKKKVREEKEEAASKAKEEAAAKAKGRAGMTTTPTAVPAVS
eukprot:gene32276-16843_t